MADSTLAVLKLKEELVKFLRKIHTTFDGIASTVGDTGLFWMVVTPISMFLARTNPAKGLPASPGSSTESKGVLRLILLTSRAPQHGFTLLRKVACKVQ